MNVISNLASTRDGLLVQVDPVRQSEIDNWQSEIDNWQSAMRLSVASVGTAPGSVNEP
jgi:hypothetical protein